MQFPQTAAACAEAAAALAGVHATTDNTPARTAANQRQQRAQEQARHAYAAELLPAILGEAWTVKHRSWNWPGALFTRSPARTPVLFHALFDHPLVFRRVGARGPAAWTRCALIGLPYDALTKEGAIAPSARDIATALAEQGIPVWVRPDLSCWYPGWTQLTLAAPGLRGLDPAAFGFQAIPALVRSGPQSGEDRGPATNVVSL